MSNFHCLSELYLRCFCIFSLQPHISIASLCFYCTHIFVLQTHICNASACFYCKSIFLLQAHILIVCAYFCCNVMEIFPTLCKKFLTLFKKFLKVWRCAKPGKQNNGNRENEATLNGDLRESKSVGKNEKSVKFFAATAVLHRKRAQKFVVRGCKEWWL